ncbi:hypothetical protein [Halopseudomonas salina]|uniref:Lipoprotein n=1 Tax=Halopseudomonas salina TaxID=1323744 RepID=A0ABQ1NZV7_9GAMM|nr:hypothetical protein [Halopseudomonas salina]GGC86284.1 hypothetical protein GCM10007418_02570 [Halopseudomonas salina]
MHIISPRLWTLPLSRERLKPGFKAIATLASVLLTGCAAQAPQTEYARDRVDRDLVSHTVQIDIGDSAVMALPQRKVRVTEQLFYQVDYFDRHGNLLDTREEYQSLPWAEKPIVVIAGNFQTTLYTDKDGHLQLNLLNDGFLDLDYQNLRVIQLSAQADQAVRGEVNLLVGRDLRSKLHEAVALIYDNLEEDDVDQWAYRVKRLAELGLDVESNQLENMLILLTTGDPMLQGEFIQALEINSRP